MIDVCRKYGHYTDLMVMFNCRSNNMTTSNGMWHDGKGVRYCTGTGTGTLTFSDVNHGIGSFREEFSLFGYWCAGNITVAR
jgi:hypothetical protein